MTVTFYIYSSATVINIIVFKLSLFIWAFLLISNYMKLLSFTQMLFKVLCTSQKKAYKLNLT